MKKIGIITLHGYHNYGNKLQNYALQETIKKLGLQVDTVVILKCDEDKQGCSYFDELKALLHITFKSDKLIILRRIKRILLQYYRKIWCHINRFVLEKRTNNFKLFSKDYLNEKYFNLDNIEIERINERYDFFITGSDQVWNPSYQAHASIYFLTFADEYKRISYAPSFGKSFIPSELKELYGKYIAGIAHLSVREEAGAKIIKDITGIEVDVLIDPTLLLTKEEWLAIAKEHPSKPKDAFMLSYFLGAMNREARVFIKQLAIKHRLKNVKLYGLKDKEAFISGPSEFIDYIKSASLVITDSFHGVVFSILFCKPFIVYERNPKSASMFSRIDTLLNIFELQHRKADNIAEDVLVIDYKNVPALLDEERNKAFEYLKNALETKNEG